MKLNNLQNRILLLKTKTGETLIPIGRMNSDRYLQTDPIIMEIIWPTFRIDFTMCNPPFYESRAEMLTSAEAKKRPPFTACTGSECEMVTIGGEVAFVSRMIDESLILKDRVRWYTSMLGKLSSVAIIQKKLKELDIDNYAIAQFVSGNRTRRWGIAWSLGDMRPSVMIARGSSNFQKGILPFPPEYHFLVRSRYVWSILFTYYGNSMTVKNWKFATRLTRSCLGYLWSGSGKSKAWPESVSVKRMSGQGLLGDRGTNWKRTWFLRVIVWLLVSRFMFKSFLRARRQPKSLFAGSRVMMPFYLKVSVACWKEVVVA